MLHHLKGQDRVEAAGLVRAVLRQGVAVADRRATQPRVAFRDHDVALGSIDAEHLGAQPG